MSVFLAVFPFIASAVWRSVEGLFGLLYCAGSRECNLAALLAFNLSDDSRLINSNFFLPLQALAMWSVIRFHHLLRSGVSWKINKNIVALWHNSSSDSDSEKTSTLSLCIDENDNRMADSTKNQSRALWLDLETSDSEIDDIKVDDKRLNDGSDEDDTLLVIYESQSDFWQ